MMRKIMTSYKPKPKRFGARWDWLASFEDSDPDDHVGHGPTEREAIDDLIEKSGASQPFQLVKPGATS